MLQVLVNFFKAFAPLADLSTPSMNLAIMLLSFLQELVKTHTRNQVSLMDNNICSVLNGVLLAPFAAAPEDKRMTLKV